MMSEIVRRSSFETSGQGRSRENTLPVGGREERVVERTEADDDRQDGSREEEEATGTTGQ